MKPRLLFFIGRSGTNTVDGGIGDDVIINNLGTVDRAH